MIDLVLLQLTDPFRIGLIIALVITMYRTAAVTGRALPLAMGVLFIAVILPTTMPSGAVTVGNPILAGIISNLIIVGPVFAIAELVARRR